MQLGLGQSEEAKAVINYRQNEGVIQYEQDPLRREAVTFCALRSLWALETTLEMWSLPDNDLIVKSNPKVISDDYLFWSHCLLFLYQAFGSHTALLLREHQSTLALSGWSLPLFSSHHLSSLAVPPANR